VRWLSFVVLAGPPLAELASSAKLDHVRQGVKPLAFYVDDNSSSCTGGVNTGGPGGTASTCAGGQADLGK